MADYRLKQTMHFCCSKFCVFYFYLYILHNNIVQNFTIGHTNKTSIDLSEARYNLEN